MATIVNRRDVILQAALPSGRVAGVTMQSNIVVDPSQVTGLGLIILGTKTLDVESSSQIYQVATSGTATPSTITLTLNLRNIVGTPSISILSGAYTGGLPALSGGPTTYTATISYASLTTDTITIRASVTESSITYTDDVTLVKVREGSNGVNAFLTNEAHTVPSDNLGNVTNWAGASGTFKVYQGAIDVSASCTYAIQTNANSLTASINSTTGAYTVGGGFSTSIDIATVTFRATYGSLTLDKIFTIAKSKNGAAGANGTNGTDGAGGQRGSRTFYLSGISSWSDASATAAATADGGPVLNDVVTEYDAGAAFSLTKFWNGSSWIVVNAVVDGNLLVSGTVGAAAFQAGAIRTSHLLVQGGKGQTLNADPTCADSTAWSSLGGTGPTFVTLTDGIAGPNAIRCTNNSYFRSTPFSVQPNKKYRVSGYYRRAVAGTGTSAMYFRILSYTTNGAAAWGSSVDYALYDLATNTSQIYEGFVPPVSSTWVKFSGVWTAPSVAAIGYLDMHANWDTNVGGVAEFQDLRVDEMVDASLVVLGGLDADRIDTRNLTIKDGSGNVIFGSGQNLDIQRIQNSFRIQNNLVDATWWSPNIAPSTSAPANGWALNGDSSENSLVFGLGPRGNQQVLWRMEAGAGGATPGHDDGGFHAPVYNIDRTKMYRFAIPVYRNNGLAMTNYFGISDVCDLNTTTPNGNPYFSNESTHPAGEWCLMVGYVFPSGSSGATHDGSGIYNLNTGVKINGGLNFTWQTGAVSATVRAYMFYSVSAACTFFAPPIVHVVDGTEPSLNELFNLNTAMQATRDIRLVTTGTGMSVQGNNCSRVGGGAWDAQCYSLDSYSLGAVCSFIPSLTSSTDAYFMAGLNTDPTTDASYTSIDYAFYMGGTSSIHIYESGSSVGGGTVYGTYAAGDVLSIAYDGSYVHYSINGTIVRSVAAPANLRMFFDSSVLYYGINQIRLAAYGNPSAVAANNPITSSNVSTYIAAVAIQDAQIATLNADKLNAGSIRGINVNASSHTTIGSYLSAPCAAAATTVSVKDTTDFPSSGTAVVADTSNDRDTFTYSGKTSNSLTGCSGVLAHNADATIIPLLKAMVIDAPTNEMRFHGDRGDGTVQELASIGIRTIGSDQNIAVFGAIDSGGNAEPASTRRGIWAASGTNNALFAQSYANFAQAVYGVNFGTGGGVGGYGAGGGPGGQFTGTSGVRGSGLSGGYGVWGDNLDGHAGGRFDGGGVGTGKWGHVYMPPLAGRPGVRTVGQLAIIYTTGGSTDARTASPRLMITDGTDWRLVDGNTVFAG